MTLTRPPKVCSAGGASMGVESAVETLPLHPDHVCTEGGVVTVPSRFDIAYLAKKCIKLGRLLSQFDLELTNFVRAFIRLGSFRPVIRPLRGKRTKGACRVNILGRAYRLSHKDGQLTAKWLPPK